MDGLRGDFRHFGDDNGYDPSEDEIGHESPPPAIAQDERRMQVRAYNHWASLLGDRTYPLLADLDAGSLPEFDPYAVLLDFADGFDDPLVRYVGAALAQQSGCGPAQLQRLSDVPPRTLLSRITDHYRQIVGNEAPVGFEAEFIDVRGRTILYRGILLPFSRDAASTGIDLVYGVINWKELADQQTTDELMQAIDKVLKVRAPLQPQPLADWADGPGAGLPAEPLDLGEVAEELPPTLDELLISARILAQSARNAEERSHHSLYAAIGRAHDFVLAAAGDPAGLEALLADAGIVVQARAPLVAVAKLVFGADYDKTRLTEYATVLSHAARIGLATGELADFLGKQPGGLKAVVQQERVLRRAEGEPQTGAAPADALTRRLRDLPALPWTDLPAQGSEITLIMARRTPDGDVVMLGEVAGDPGLVQRAARRLLG